MMPFRDSLRFAALLATLGSLGCGNPGPPVPPSLLLPQPVGDLAAQRTGDSVTLHWTMPSHSTDRVALRGSRRVVVCRSLGDARCEIAGTADFAALAPGTFTEVLPPDLLRNRPQLLTYRIRLQNQHGTDAGPSNAAYSASGPAPPALREASGKATANGVSVQWTTASATGGLSSAGGKHFARLERRTLQQAAAPKAPAKATENQILESAETPSWEPKEALDRAAVFNLSYRYQVALVSRIELAGHLVEVDGLGAATAEFPAKDTFAPDAPGGLEAVANPQSRTIDLSWTANTEPDLAGYRVYRRIPGEPGTPRQISGAKLVAEPAWSDPSAKAGVRYSYSVSAVDTTGNESSRSQETSEALP